MIPLRCLNLSQLVDFTITGTLSMPSSYINKRVNKKVTLQPSGQQIASRQVLNVSDTTSNLMVKMKNKIMFLTILCQTSRFSSICLSQTFSFNCTSLLTLRHSSSFSFGRQMNFITAKTSILRIGMDWIRYRKTPSINTFYC